MQGTWAEASKKAARTPKAGMWLKLSLQPLPSRQLSFTIHSRAVTSAPSTPQVLGCRESPLSTFSWRPQRELSTMRRGALASGPLGKPRSFAVIQGGNGLNMIPHSHSAKTTGQLVTQFPGGVLARTESSHCGSRDFNRGAIYRPWLVRETQRPLPMGAVATLGLER